MKLKKKDLKLVLYAGGILALLAGYFLGYQHFAENQTSLEARRDALQAEEAQVAEIYENQSTYEAEAEKAEQMIEEIVAKYPADVRTEDSILYAIDLEDSFDAEISSLTLNTDNLLYTIGSGAGEEEAATETEETASNDYSDAIGIIDTSTVQLPQVSLLDTQVTYNFTAGYEDCKTMFASIIDYVEKRNVTNLSLSYNGDSGELNGNMVVVMYYLSGTDKVYEEQDTGVTNFGTDDIFGSLKKSEKNEREQS
jgi:hypothetical protein